MEAKRNLRKERIGTVISNKSDKTAVVLITRKVKHPIYGKIMKKTKKFHAHDPENSCQIGDVVSISENRRLSKKKCWHLNKIIKKAN